MHSASISIITPSFNQCRFLARTAQSILSQQGDFTLQWIVMDGGSTDGSVQLLHTYAKDPRVTIVSERDHGQSDAINKGMAKANGEIVAFLNSDDLYVPGALAAVSAAFAAHPNAHWLVGGCRNIDADDNPIRSAVERYKLRRIRQYSYNRLLIENFIPQPAVFWRRSFGQKVGPIDESLHYAMDYDLWLRMGRQADPLIIDTPLACFRLHQDSKSCVIIRKQFDVGYQIASRYCSGLTRFRHRLQVEKIVLAYRVMRLIGI